MDAIGNTPLAVFTFLTEVYNFFPPSIKFLLFVSFGGMVFISVLRGIGR